jgi:hypothetical protein
MGSWFGTFNQKSEMLKMAAIEVGLPDDATEDLFLRIIPEASRAAGNTGEGLPEKEVWPAVQKYLKERRINLRNLRARAKDGCPKLKEIQKEYPEDAPKDDEVHLWNIVGEYGQWIQGDCHYLEDPTRKEYILNGLLARGNRKLYEKVINETSA